MNLFVVQLTLPIRLWKCNTQMAVATTQIVAGAWTKKKKEKREKERKTQISILRLWQLHILFVDWLLHHIKNRKNQDKFQWNGNRLSARLRLPNWSYRAHLFQRIEMYNIVYVFRHVNHQTIHPIRCKQVQFCLYRLLKLVNVQLFRFQHIFTATNNELRNQNRWDTNLQQIKRKKRTNKVK